MPKQKITISLDTEIAEKLRLQSIEKYHNSRSLSKYIEDLATGAAEAEPLAAIQTSIHPVADLPDAINPLTECRYINRDGFVRSVDMAYKRIIDMELTDAREDRVTGYFVLKAAYELVQNETANEINKCFKCCFLNGPLPTYPECDDFAHMDQLRNRVMMV